jgi:hypothetical protein
VVLDLADLACCDAAGLAFIVTAHADLAPDDAA